MNSILETLFPTFFLSNGSLCADELLLCGTELCQWGSRCPTIFEVRQYSETWLLRAEAFHELLNVAEYFPTIESIRPIVYAVFHVPDFHLHPHTCVCFDRGCETELSGWYSPRK